MREAVKDAEGYVLGWSWEQHGGMGIRVFVRLDRALSENDHRALDAAVAGLTENLRRETLRLDPQTHERAAVERAEIVNLFPGPIYVEEIPNGYCSRSCCAYKPWFVVTTTRGRIRIGWRKSVLHLEWTDTQVKKTADELFPKENVTRYEKVIHCWGYEKAREYIRHLMVAE